MGLYGNPWVCIGNDRIPHRNLCESAWGEISHPQRSVWDKIPCAGTPKGHAGLQRKPYRTIQDEIHFAQSRKGNRVGRCGLIILTQNRTELPTQEPTRGP